jgi:hypothetical protein
MQKMKGTASWLMQRCCTAKIEGRKQRDAGGEKRCIRSARFDSGGGSDGPVLGQFMG